MGQSSLRNFKITFVVVFWGGTTLVVLLVYQNIQKVKKQAYFNMDNINRSKLSRVNPCVEQRTD